MSEVDQASLAFKEDDLYMGFFCCKSSLLCCCVTPLLRSGCLEARGIFILLTDTPWDISSRYHTQESFLWEHR